MANIYLDNNATTMMPPEIVEEMVRWCNRGNPSSGHAAAGRSRAMMNAFSEELGRLLGVNTCCREDRDVEDQEAHDIAKLDPNRYRVIFTSGASEANTTIIQSVVDAYGRALDRIPHLVISAIEHKSIIATAKSLQDRGLATVTFVSAGPDGIIKAIDIGKAIKPNTCLVCVQHANNETGIIQPVDRIAKVAHDKGVPFHCDAVQSFGKFPPQLHDIDSVSISFHKLHGPPGVGALVIKQKFLHGYKLAPLIHGAQNGGHRGGTENLPGLGASFAAMRLTHTNRQLKNKHLGDMHVFMLRELAQRTTVIPYSDYLVRPIQEGIVILSKPLSSGCAVPGVVLLSVVSRRVKICNVELRKFLEDKKIIVSVGSACNTASKYASHVLGDMDADEYIKRGALRISFGDANTIDHARALVHELINAARQQWGSRQYIKSP